MIAGFVDSWPLFYPAYLAGWLLAALLSICGVIVVARDQIFLGAAVAQSSTLGVATGLWLAAVGLGPGWSWLYEGPALTGWAIAGSILAALAAARAGRTGRGETPEAVTGWVFLMAASLSVLIVSGSPHGLEEVQQIMASSIIVASPGEVWLYAGLLTGAVTALALTRRPLLLVVLDRPMAAAVGLRVGLWDTVLAVVLGVVGGLSIKSAGMIYPFGFLVLPALVAKNLVREVRSLLWLAPVAGLVAAAVGAVLSNHLDLPPGQLMVALLAGALAAAWLWRLLPWRRTG